MAHGTCNLTNSLRERESQTIINWLSKQTFINLLLDKVDVTLDETNLQENEIGMICKHLTKFLVHGTCNSLFVDLFFLVQIVNLFRRKKKKYRKRNSDSDREIEGQIIKLLTGHINELRLLINLI